MFKDLQVELRRDYRLRLSSSELLIQLILFYRRHRSGKDEKDLMNNRLITNEKKVAEDLERNSHGTISKRA